MLLSPSSVTLSSPSQPWPRGAVDVDAPRVVSGAGVASAVRPMVDLTSLQWCVCDGVAPDAVAPDLVLLDAPPLLDRPHRGRQILRASLDGQAVVVKLRRLRWRKGLRGRRGRRFLGHERQMLQLAGRCGLPVPRVLAWAEQRLWGAPVAQALVVTHHPGRVAMNTLLGRSATAGQALQMLADLLGRVRQAGLTDHDFSAANVLVRRHAEPDPLLVDIESAWPAEPTDAAGTCCTIAPALANLWRDTQDPDLCQAWLADLPRHVPTPVGGWARLGPRLDRRTRRIFARRWPDLTPPPATRFTVA